MVDLAGRVGVGEWRPEKNGTFGQFKINKILTPKESAEALEGSRVSLETPSIPTWALDTEIEPEDLKRMFDGTRAGAEDGMKRAKTSKQEEQEEEEGTDE